MVRLLKQIHIYASAVLEIVSLSLCLSVCSLVRHMRAL